MTLSTYSGIYIDDGLGVKAKTRYAKRRKTLLKKLGHAYLISGVQKQLNAPHTWSYGHMPIYQEPLFLYLTGINQPGAVLWVSEKKEILFLPEKDDSYTFWEGTHFGVGSAAAIKEVKQVTGFKDVLDLEDLWDCLPHVHNNKTTLGLYWHLKRSGRGVLQDENAQFLRQAKRHMKGVPLQNISETQWCQRLCLDTIDQGLAKDANQKTTKAFKKVLSELKGCKNENEVMGHLEGEISRQSPHKTSFPSIVANGQNATTLHYTKNDAPLKKGNLLLLDFGVRWHSMHADVSRCIPVNGRFNPLQKLIYNIVLDTQNAVIKKIKAGVSIHDLNSFAWDFLEDLLDKQVLEQGGEIKRAYDKAPHNIGHFLGLEVHDGGPSRHRAKLPLVPGNMITVEPGFYGTVKLKIEGKLYEETLGIRIEDNLIVTATGALNLTTCPKTVAAIEKAINLTGK